MVASKVSKTQNIKSKEEKKEKTPDESFEPIKVETRLANTAILMLESPEDEIVQKACESIFKFCEKSDANKLSVHELGATPKLFALVSHEERTIQRNATMAFGILSSNSEVRKYLRKVPAHIEKMLSLLSPDSDPLVNEYAAMWMRNMCEDYSTKTVVGSNQLAISTLISMLNSNDPDAVYNSLGTIEKLMADYQPRQLIRELKGIEPILNLMKSEFPQIQELVFSALVKITQNTENREHIRDIGGLEKLVDFLSNQDFKDMHVNCLNVLSNCLEDTHCLDLIQQTGGLTKILSYCQELSEDPQMSQINAAAARVIARSARKAENRKILNEQFAEKMLIYLLLGDNDETKVCSAHALSIMAESGFSQDAIRNYEGIEALIRLLTSDNSKIREYCCLALSNLTYKNTNNCRNILNNQGTEIIVNLLKDEKDTTKAYACICLTNMASDEIIREEVAQFSFALSIIPALNSANTFTQTKACLAVAAFSIDSLIRNELRTAAVLPLIVQHIKSNNDEVRFSACWALTCSAFDHAIAIDYCKFGAIELLRDLNQSTQRKSTFTDSALKKLLEANLSAKYALTNHLDGKDVILDGFYDMGPMRPNGKFYSLDDVYQNPVNDKRPIIVVFAPEELRVLATNREKTSTPAEIMKSESLTKIKSSSKSSQSSKKENKDSKETKGRVESGKSRKQDSKKAIQENVTSSQQIFSQPSSSTDEKLRDDSIYGMSLYKPIFDKDLRAFYDQIKDTLMAQRPQVQAVNLAHYVCEKMGGSISRDDLANLGYELLINEVKLELKSNIIPIGRIRVGTYYHRALLYKVLADKINLRVTLERGDYNRAWNIIALKEENSNLPPKQYIVDLMHEPGKLMPINSIDANQYITI